MSKIFKLSIFVAILSIAFVFSASPKAVSADDSFDLYVKHNINGKSLGFDKALPVDVYVNGGKAFSFSFGESFLASLPAGEYFIEVNLGLLLCMWNRTIVAHLIFLHIDVYTASCR